MPRVIPFVDDRPAESSRPRAVAAFSLNRVLPSVLEFFFQACIPLELGDSSSRSVATNAFVKSSPLTCIGSERLTLRLEHFLNASRALNSQERSSKPLPGVQSADLLVLGVAGNLKSFAEMRSAVGTLSTLRSLPTGLSFRALLPFAPFRIEACSLTWVSIVSMAVV